MNYKDVAILYRTNQQGVELRNHLESQGIPVNVKGGLNLTDQKEVKDVLAFLAWIVNPDDAASLLRFCAFAKTGVGEHTVLSCYTSLKNSGLDPSLQSLKAFANASKSKRVKAMGYLVDHAIRIGNMQQDVYGCLTDVITTFNVMDICSKEDHKNPRQNTRHDNILALAQMAHNYQNTLEKFLDDIFLESTQEDPEDNKVTLLTMHKSKGLEFPTVFVYDCGDQTMPHKMAKTPEEVEQEKNLLYVALTRAKNKLYITSAKEKTDIITRDRVVNNTSPYITTIVPTIEKYGTVELVEPKKQEPKVNSGYNHAFHKFKNYRR